MPTCLRLVVAGGWDARLGENVGYYAELAEMVKSSGLDGAVSLRRNVTTEERRRLFAECAALVYTPADEHFGIVPLEVPPLPAVTRPISTAAPIAIGTFPWQAMASGRPVIAVGSGGPTETVVDGVTGWLREPTPAAFAQAYADVLRMAGAGGAGLRAMGAAARARVVDHFSLDAFGERLASHLGD